MLIVAVAWIYVVGLMAVTEPSVVAGVMTFLIYCVIPLAILYYLTGSRRRKNKRARQEYQAQRQQQNGQQAEGQGQLAARDTPPPGPPSEE